MEVLSQYNVYKDYFNDKIKSTFEELKSKFTVDIKNIDSNSTYLFENKTVFIENNKISFIDEPLYNYIKTRIKNSLLNINQKKMYFKQTIDIFKNEHIDEKEKQEFIKKIDSLIFFTEISEISKRNKKDLYSYKFKTYSDYEFSSYISQYERMEK